MGNPYNGYAWSERMAKFREMGRRLASRDLPCPGGPCQLCGDPGTDDATAVFEYHDEDYSLDVIKAVHPFPSLASLTTNIDHSE